MRVKLDLKAIQEELLSFLKSKLPGLKQELVLRPFSDFNSAHLTSDIIFDYAKQQKQNPAEIAQQLNSQEFQHFKVSFSSGYLKVYLKSFDPSSTWQSKYLKEARIILPLVKNNSSLSAVCRVSAGAVWQYFLAKRHANSQLLIISEDQEINFEISWLQNKIKNLGNFPAESFNQYCENLNLDSSVTFWMSPQFLTKEEFSSFYKKLIVNHKQINYQLPSREWAEGLSSELIDLYSNASEEDFYALSLLMASGITAELVYPEEALLPQKNNLLWYAKSLQARLKTYQFASPKADNDSLEQLSDLQQTLCLRCNFWRYFLEKAVNFGAVSEFIDFTKSYLDDFSCYFNSPQLRYQIEQSQLSALDQALLFKVSNDIDSIVDLLSFNL